MDSELAAELVVQRRQGGSQLGGRPDRAQGVVFVQLGDAEYGHDRVADELLDRPSVAFEDLGHALEPAGHHLPERLRIEAFPERCGVGDVGEEDGDRSPAYGHVLSVGLGLGED